jgi:hypothetical protein
MPLMRYFVFVGGALLALLFIVDACLPGAPAAQTAPTAQQATDLSVIRIHSNQKWPEKVVFDTAQPTTTPAPAPVATVAEAAAPQKIAVAQPVKGQVREAFAEMRNLNESRNAEAKRKRKSVARNNYYAPPPRMMVAQQRPAFFFGNNVW